MSRLLITLSILLCGLMAQGQSHIKGQIENFYGAHLRLNLPQNGVSVPAELYTLNIDDAGRFDVAFSTQGSGFVTFYHYGTASEIRFWISPGSEDEITFDWADPQSSFQFSGTHAVINQWLNSEDLQRVHHEEFDKRVEAFAKNYDTAKELVSLVAHTQSMEQKNIAEANSAKEMDPVYDELARKEAHYFWNYLLLSVFTKQGKTRFQGEGVEDLKVENLNDPAAQKTSYYFLYLQQYFEQLYPEMDHWQRYQRFADHLNEPILETFRANYLYWHGLYGDRDYSLVPALTNFKKAYPKSVSIGTLETKINPVEDKYLMAQEPITDQMVIIEDTAVSASIQDFLAQYQGEVLYVDIWASWCRPCIQELNIRYKKPLKDFIKDKPVRMVYVSIDRDEAHDTWLSAVKKNRLNSINLRFTGQKVTDLIRYLGVQEGDRFGIPRYFILDKEGNLVNANAPIPSDGEKLYAELSKYL